MAGSLHWREKVVHSIVILLVIAFCTHTAYAQSTPRVTFTYKSAHLKTVVDDLAQASGLHVIYSPDKINMMVSVTLAPGSKTVEEVLTTLEKQTNLSFKIQDRHIIIKPGAVVVSKPIESKPARVFHASPILPPDSLLITGLEETPERNITWQPLASTDRYVANQLVTVRPLFDTALLKKLPASYVQKMNSAKHQRKWFISAGMLMNNYSTGLELQAGWRNLYAVFSPTWLSNATFHGGYGLGSSIRLSEDFSLNPVYLYSQASQKRTFTVTEFGRPVHVLQYKSFVRHHQLKLMVQHALSDNISIAFGPALNQSTTWYSVSETNTLMGSFTERGVVMPVQYVKVTSTHDHMMGNTNTFFSTSSVTRMAQYNRLWLGWEASLSFRLNFK